MGKVERNHRNKANNAANQSTLVANVNTMRRDLRSSTPEPPPVPSGSQKKKSNGPAKKGVKTRATFSNETAESSVRSKPNNTISTSFVEGENLIDMEVSGDDFTELEDSQANNDAPVPHNNREVQPSDGEITEENTSPTDLSGGEGSSAHRSRSPIPLPGKSKRGKELK